MVARSAFHSDDQMLEPSMTASGLTVLTRMPCLPPSSARQRARCSEAALADEYAAALAPATSAFLEPTKTIAPPRALLHEHAQGLARGQEVAARQHRVVAFPTRRRVVSMTGALVAMPALDTRTSTPPYASTARRTMSATASSLGDVDVRRPSARRAPRAAHDLVGHGGGAVGVEVGHDDVRAELGQAARRRAADAAARRR